MSNDHDNRVSLLERDLQELGRAQAHDEIFRRELRLALQAQAARRPRASFGLDVRRRLDLRRAAPRRRLVLLLGTAAGAAAAAVIVAYVGLSGSTQLGGPAQASAASVLAGAAANAVVPGEVVHYTYRYSAQPPAVGATPSRRASSRRAVSAGAAGGQHLPGVTGSVDVWVDGGAPARSVQTVTLSKTAGASEGLIGRYVQIGARTFGYDATHDALTLPSAQNAAPAIVLPNEAYDGASLAQSIEQLAARGSHVVALAPQTLEGRSVDVIQADGALERPALRLTLYFDAQTHLLRGFDAASIDPAYPTPSWQVRLQSATAVTPASVPAGTFSLELPTATSRVALRPKLALPPKCAKPTTPDATLLSTCQAGDPGLTAQQLATTLAQPSLAELREAVADGVLSAAQASVAEAGLEAQFVRLVTAPKPSASEGSAHMAGGAGRR